MMKAIPAVSLPSPRWIWSKQQIQAQMEKKQRSIAAREARSSLPPNPPPPPPPTPLTFISLPPPPPPPLLPLIRFEVKKPEEIDFYCYETLPDIPDFHDLPEPLSDELMCLPPLFIPDEVAYNDPDSPSSPIADPLTQEFDEFMRLGHYYDLLD